ncbi:hypothetical protein BMUNKI379_10470 [Burkholderia multivorans]|uniref:hypothetical protein n=1 Tax=Burkholderia multivorans TaxID=87883 RepID=UPI0006C7CD0F|nr:hypothetical protein [Burkholderia multivorans]KPJ34873.1 hypothetical protein BMUNKI379_10470 [Burkholderia multivorans]
MVRPFSKADIVTQDKGFPYIEFVIPKMRGKAAGRDVRALFRRQAAVKRLSEAMTGPVRQSGCVGVVS